ncbi:MAG TPA: bifunctional 4-hydroxy-2-oxoglutarate aldolase/2-dehydro-3-deoxy-phosphogluconate aldolase, partial [Bryobacteraceae bacterium]|nr:bifunctional 4-hydroxy-2-oxoglutarate aldolase/2-dehydro-3-deoxy-phosphogluconate aldolase [Bryobacteraceae bacterium]
ITANGGAVTQMDAREVRARIEEVGIIPSIRVSEAADALMAAEAIAGGGIPIVEVTMTVADAYFVVSALKNHRPGMVVGAGTVLDLGTARRCLDAGADFLTSPGLDLDIVEFARKRGAFVFPGVMTPTDVMAALRAGTEMVKIFPCAPLGGPAYVKAMQAPFPDVPLIAAGGVDQLNVADYILAGAAAVGVGAHLIPRKAIELRQPERIHELAMRFVAMVREARRLRSGAMDI